MKRAALILAGGQSTRMGADKALLQFGNQTFIERIHEVCAAVCDDVSVAVGANRRAALPAAASVLEDAGEGPLLAVAGALQHGVHLFVTACDTPLLVPSLIELLFARAEGQRGAIPMVGGHLQGTCAVYSGDLAEEARRLVAAGERRIAALAKLPGVVTIQESDLRSADPDLRSFMGCNTPEEYRELLAFAQMPLG